MTDQPQPEPISVNQLPPMTDRDKEIARTMFNRQSDGAPFGDASDQPQTAKLIGATARHDGEYVAVTLFSWGSEMTIRIKPSQATALVYELTRAANLATYERWDRLANGTEDDDV